MVFESNELNVLIKKIEDKGFIVSQLPKITMKIYSNLSNINI